MPHIQGIYLESRPIELLTRQQTLAAQDSDHECLMLHDTVFSTTNIIQVSLHAMRSMAGRTLVISQMCMLGKGLFTLLRGRSSKVSRNRRGCNRDTILSPITPIGLPNQRPLL